MSNLAENVPFSIDGLTAPRSPAKTAGMLAEKIATDLPRLITGATNMKTRIVIGLSTAALVVGSRCLET
jgi:hypothetical protein